MLRNYVKMVANLTVSFMEKITKNSYKGDSSMLQDYIKKRRGIIVKEKDLITTLRILDDINNKFRFDIFMDMEVSVFNDDGHGNVEWYIDFTANNKKWNRFISTVYGMNHTVILRENDNYCLI